MRASSAAFVAALLLLGGCAPHCGCSAPPMAELVATTGTVTAARSARPAVFAAASVGTTFDLGDAVRTARRSTARLHLDDGSTLDVRPSSTLRFSPTRPGARRPRVDVLAGEAVLSVDAETELETRAGVAHLASGSRVTLRATENEGLELVVTLGRARLETDEGPKELGVGAAISVDASGRTRSPTTAAPPSSGNAPNAPSSTPPSAPPVDPPAGAVRAVTTGAHRVRVGDADEWSDLVAGTHALTPGTRVRQEEGGAIELSRDGASLALRGAAEFTVGEGHTLANLVSGTPSLESGTEGVAIVTSGGVLVTRPSSSGRTVARLARDADRGLEVHVSEGTIEVQRDGESLRVEAGAMMSLATQGDAAGEDVVPASDSPSVLASRTDFHLGAGENLVVRDLHPPTAIAVGVGERCPDGAEVELLAASGSRVVGVARGRGSIPVLFPEGSQRYQVRCLSGGAPSRSVVARGRIRIMRSSGQAPLPRSAPESTVEADGRTYTVLYQNQLPAITAHWPGGPSGATVLVVSSSSGTRRFSAGGTRHRLAPGTLGEGTMRLHFESPSSGRRSRDTTLVIRFDPAAASASLTEPSDGGFAPGATVRVAGVALPGWTVHAGDHDIPVGGDQRFSGQATVPASGVLVVRLARAGHGVHYYVRRSRAATP